MSTIARFSNAEIIEAFDYLDELRESGRTNMWAAANYVVAELHFSREDARDLVLAWMRTFSTGQPVEERAAKASESKP